jgi:hypothetical protein
MKLFHHNDSTPRARASWARSIESLIRDIDRPQPLLRSMRPIYRRDVAAAAVPALTEIRWVLVDEQAIVRPEAMARLREFLTDGSRSPLYHDDPEAARRLAHELASAFVVPASSYATKAARDHEVREPVAASGRA